MATKRTTIDVILDQLVSVENVSARKMFGEYALYRDGKVIGLVCDDTLFLKITDAGKEFAGRSYKEGIPYPGAKPSMMIDTDDIGDREWLGELVRITGEGLPRPKKKRPAKKR